MNFSLCPLKGIFTKPLLSLKTYEVFAETRYSWDLVFGKKEHVHFRRQLPTSHMYVPTLFDSESQEPKFRDT